MKIINIAIALSTVLWWYGVAAEAYYGLRKRGGLEAGHRRGRKAARARNLIMANVDSIEVDEGCTEQLDNVMSMELLPLETASSMDTAGVPVKTLLAVITKFESYPGPLSSKPCLCGDGYGACPTGPEIGGTSPDQVGTSVDDVTQDEIPKVYNTGKSTDVGRSGDVDVSKDSNISNDPIDVLGDDVPGVDGPEALQSKDTNISNDPMDLDGDGPGVSTPPTDSEDTDVSNDPIDLDGEENEPRTDGGGGDPPGLESGSGDEDISNDPIDLAEEDSEDEDISNDPIDLSGGDGGDGGGGEIPELGGGAGDSWDEDISNDPIDIAGDGDEPGTAGVEGDSPDETEPSTDGGEGEDDDSTDDTNDDVTNEDYGLPGVVSTFDDTV